MILDTAARFMDNYNIEDIFISTGRSFLPRVQEIFPDLPERNIIIEPEKRDTGPAMGYVAAYMSISYPDEPIVFVPSDHYIANVKKFIRSIEVAESVIRETGKMMDIAVTPNFPSTILGYTRIGEKYREIDDVDIYRFVGHTEKPKYEVAKKYVEDGNYLWHANFYMWTPKKFLEAYKKYAPHIYDSLEKIIGYLKQGDRDSLKEEYSTMEKISIDYAVTENMDPADVLIIKGDFGWSDIGAWDVLHDHLLSKADENKNLAKGDWLGLDTSNSIIYGSDNKLIATVGVDDMVIVDTPDALLVCPKGRSQDVKRLVDKLEEEQRKEYL